MPRDQQSAARMAIISKKGIAARKAMSEFDKAVMKLRQRTKRKKRAK
jgi:hypothetical protein